jgi:Ras-related protein Rab-6A
MASLHKWIEDVRAARGEEAVIIVAANKADLEEGREISPEEIKHLAEELSVICFETSAQTGDNVRKLFFEAAKQLPQATNLPDNSRLGETIHVTP